tara:strand:- start:2991 stop:3632 length:642 start_codon:yes stop_codon:yes gene_type:complete
MLNEKELALLKSFQSVRMIGNDHIQSLRPVWDKVLAETDPDLAERINNLLPKEPVIHSIQINANALYDCVLSSFYVAGMGTYAEGLFGDSLPIEKKFKMPIVEVKEYELELVYASMAKGPIRPVTVKWLTEHGFRIQPHSSNDTLTFIEFKDPLKDKMNHLSVQLKVTDEHTFVFSKAGPKIPAITTLNYIKQDYDFGQTNPNEKEIYWVKTN